MIFNTSKPLFLKQTEKTTLALSRSGNTGISQPSQRRAPRVKLLIKQLLTKWHFVVM